MYFFHALIFLPEKRLSIQEDEIKEQIYLVSIWSFLLATQANKLVIEKTTYLKQFGFTSHF
jgi:hypothetical protein